MRLTSDGVFDNLVGPRDPPPIGRSGERPSLGWAMPTPTRGGGCANAIDSIPMQQALENMGDPAVLRRRHAHIGGEEAREAALRRETQIVTDIGD